MKKIIDSGGFQQLKKGQTLPTSSEHEFEGASIPYLLEQHREKHGTIYRDSHRWDEQMKPLWRNVPTQTTQNQLQKSRRKKALEAITEHRFDHDPKLYLDKRLDDSFTEQDKEPRLLTLYWKYDPNRLAQDDYFKVIEKRLQASGRKSYPDE